MPRRPRRYNRANQITRFRRARAKKRARRYVPSRTGIRKLRFSKVHRPIGGFPPRRTTVLRYVEDFSLNAGDGTSAVNVFAINNLFDPNYTGTGHQPMFYDNYSALYARYKVNSATITFVAIDNHMVNTTTPNLVDGTNVGDNQFFSESQKACRMFVLADCLPNDYPNDLDNLIEEGNPRLRWKYCFQNTSARAQKITMKAWPHKIWNVPFKENALQSLTSTGPQSTCYFICGVDSMPGKNMDAMRFQAIITYNVTFFDFIANQTQN